MPPGSVNTPGVCQHPPGSVNTPLGLSTTPWVGRHPGMSRNLYNQVGETCLMPAAQTGSLTGTDSEQYAPIDP